jgi:hypothetical protein
MASAPYGIGAAVASHFDVGFWYAARHWRALLIDRPDRAVARFSA